MRYQPFLCAKRFTFKVYLTYESSYMIDYRNGILKNVGVLMVACALFFSRVQYGYAATVKVMSWRLIHGGCLYYSVSSDFEDYVTVAKNKWNNYKSGVIKKSSTNCDAFFRGSGNLSSGINGVTYSSGMIYFNTVNWAFLNEKQKKNCAIHEMGHALGLDDNNGTSKNVMYKGTTENRTLSANDKASYDTSYALSFGC